MRKCISMGMGFLASLALATAVATAQSGGAGGVGGTGSAAGFGGPTAAGASSAISPVPGGNTTQFGQPAAAHQQSTVGAQAPQGAPAQLGAGNQALPPAQPQGRDLDQPGDWQQEAFSRENSYLRGDASRGELGVWLIGTTENGVRIGRINPGSAADIAGLQPGDVLLSVNGAPVSSPLGVRQMVREIPVGQAAELIVLRDGVQQQVSATLAAARNYQTGYRGDDMIGAGGDLAARTQRLEEQVGMMLREMRQMREEMSAMRTSGAGAVATPTAPSPATSLAPSENLFDDQPSSSTPFSTETEAEPAATTTEPAAEPVAEPAATEPAATEPADDEAADSLFDSEPAEPATEADASPAESTTSATEEATPAAEAEAPAEPEAASDAATETEADTGSDELFN